VEELIPTYGCTLQLCSWWWVQIAPETCTANDERNKEYSVHLVGPELNIYYQDVQNHEHQTNKGAPYKPNRRNPTIKQPPKY
jgi:hypothetical protein